MSQNIVLAIHGLGGHSGWFQRLADELEKHDIGFKAYDLPGFGNNHSLAEGGHSPYTKGHIDSYMDWVDFVQANYQKLKNDNPGSKITILGHSLGAVIATNLYEIFSGDKLILSVPGYKGQSSTFNPWFMLGTAKKILIDKFIFASDVYVEMPVSDKAKDTPAMNDPLRVGSVTQTLLYEIVRMRSITNKNIRNIQVPVLMIQVENDKVVDNQAQNDMFELIPSEHKIFKTYSGTDHDWIWYDVVDLVARDIAGFINS